jgi:hypothetical protein
MALVGYIIIFALAVIYHIMINAQVKKGGFKDHLKVEPNVLVIGLAMFIAVSIVLFFNISNWDSMLVWLPMLVFTTVWFVFSLAVMTHRLTPKDELLSLAGSLLVMVWSLVVIVLQFIG